jgi:hypothetical protein
MLPNFLIIGAQKSATSWLASALGEHPDVFVSDLGDHFFDTHFDRGVDWYETQFQGWSGQKAIGEKWPGYLSHPDAPSRIRQTLGPDVRLIASLRHPVDRAYSAYWHAMDHGRISPQTEFKQAFREHHRLAPIGRYGAQVSRFLEHFPRESLHLLLYDQIRGSPDEALRSCFTFIGVEPVLPAVKLSKRANPSVGLSVFHNQVLQLQKFLRRLPKPLRSIASSVGRKGLSVLPAKRKYEPLDPAVRQELLSEFTDDMALLEERTGLDVSIWRGSK